MISLTAQKCLVGIKEASHQSIFSFNIWARGSLTDIFPRQPAAMLFHLDLDRVPFRNFIYTMELEPFLA
jgi:hypothetical protein